MTERTRFENRISIVTGGANGIGRAIALGLAREGSDIVVADIEAEPAQKVADEILALGRKSLAIKVDVANSKDTERMAEIALNSFSAIDILINCAGGPAPVHKLFNESEEEVWDHIIALNLKGVRNCTRAVINHMLERRRGKIINIASLAGILGDIGMSDYSAAKAGIIGFSKALAKEVASYGINVNCVSPGPIMTRALAIFPDKIKQSEITTGLGRVGKPEEVAALVIFLVSEEASFITGQNYPICGLEHIGVNK